MHDLDGARRGEDRHVGEAFDDSGQAFAELVHEDVILEGSSFAQPIAGREAVRKVCCVPAPWDL